MKRKIVFAVLLAALMLAVSGCSKDGESSGTSGSPEGDAKPEEIVMPEEEDGGIAAEEDESVSEDEVKDTSIEDRNVVCAEDSFSAAASYITKYGDSPRVLNYALDVYSSHRKREGGRFEESYTAALEKSENDLYKRIRYLRADKNGSSVNVSVYTDPETLIIDRIITEEFCATGREVTDYFFEEGKLVYAYRYMNDLFGALYEDDSLPGKKCSFRDEVMTGCVIDDQDVGFKKVSYDADSYGSLDEFSKAQYDELEKNMIKSAYITYEAVRGVPGFATVSGYVGDEFGGYLANVHMSITSKANGYEAEFETNGDGYFEIKIPVNTADRYGVVCKYGDYTPSTVDDIDIVPGTIDYSLGVIYMAEPGNGVHEANTYLLNANSKSPKLLWDGEYCVVFDYEDKSADLKPFSVNLESKEMDSDSVTVIKAGKNDQYKYYVTDQRGGMSGNPMTYEMSTSRAVVKVYDNKGLVASYQVPAGVAGTVWEVFGVKNGKIYPVNNYLIEATADPFFK